ncbi:hypothetical protein Nepgr_020324 [Nepenthes gracilis]|uniref:Maltose excess protein 1-like, chloroplastic n=1 Tax=Nepenthes gracilis TaxID=150966 RepID=A0AAD3SUV9_NEPGR|nr:hypothetical protein Nepgr_020324 [Nepenthes gracilis]
MAAALAAAESVVTVGNLRACSPCSTMSPFPSSSVALPSTIHLLNKRHHHCPFFSLSSQSLFHRRFNFNPRAALDSDVPRSVPKGRVKFNSDSLKQWDRWTAKFAAAANVPFLLLQLPQIVLNARNLMAGNNSALSAVPWLGFLTGLLGNLSLLSYFAKKRETEAMLVQTLGVVSMYVVIAQLAMAEAMPFPYFACTSAVVAAGLIFNFLNYFGMLHPSLWCFWEDSITIGGLSVLPQVIWSTFVPYIPSSILPGSVSFFIALAAVVLVRMGKLSEKGVSFVRAISGWTATLLFMWMPISQMWTNFLNPDNIKGLSAFSMLLAMIGNGLMIPRALFIRDIMWFTGSSWATFLYGWGNLVCLYWFNCIGWEFFMAATGGLFLWIGYYAVPYPHVGFDLLITLRDGTMEGCPSLCIQFAPKISEGVGVGPTVMSTAHYFVVLDTVVMSTPSFLMRLSRT